MLRDSNTTEVPERYLTARDVLEGIAAQLEDDETIPDRIIIRQATPTQFVGRIYSGLGNDYEGYAVSAD